MKDLNQERAEFMKAAIPFVCEMGWGDEALRKASEDYPILFGDVCDAVKYFEDLEDMRSLKAIGNKKEGESIRGYIGKMLIQRIGDISGGREMLTRLKEFYFSHLTLGPKALWNTSDVIWHAAGDRSLDINYYSKRLLLAGVYRSSIKYYLSEKANFEQHVADSLNKVISCAKYLKPPKLEDIPVLRLFS